MLKLDWGCLYIPLRRLHFALFPFFFFNHRNRSQNPRSKSSFSFEAINNQRITHTIHSNQSLSLNAINPRLGSRASATSSCPRTDLLLPTSLHKTRSKPSFSLEATNHHRNRSQKLFKAVFVVQSYQPKTQLASFCYFFLSSNRLSSTHASSQKSFKIIVFSRSYQQPSKSLTKTIQSNLRR